jgi:hypothetical protein
MRIFSRYFRHPPEVHEDTKFICLFLNIPNVDELSLLFPTLNTPQNIDPSWRKNMVITNFSKSNFDMKNHDDKKSHKLNWNLPLKILVEFGKNILAQNVFKRDR